MFIPQIHTATIWARCQIQLGVECGPNYTLQKGEISLRGAEDAHCDVPQERFWRDMG